MKVKFSNKTDKDFLRHRDYLSRKGKSDGHKYQKYELDGISKSLKKNIKNGIEEIKDHKDSIFPKEYEYNASDYKMFVDKKSHHIVFYRIEKDSKGKSFIEIDKCIQSSELEKDLEKRGIKPLKDADQSLIDDLNDVYKEDEINLRDDEEEEKGKEEEVYDEETGEKVKRIVYTGPRGGRYYKGKKGEQIYVDERKAIKGLRSMLLECGMVSLSDYITKGGAVTPPNGRVQSNGKRNLI